ncbi:protein FD-like [Salvia splendens]|uniref:protein FD-like n=1 Tax=Salvia splendens TaxID=180675 RepID=UPI001C2589D2|nr:protein FD-like [Salvia splendens]
MGPSPPKEFGHFPLFDIDHQFLKDNPPLMMNFSTLDNKTLIKNNVALSPEETMMQNPSFSSGSSSATSPPILHENPNTKPVDGVWNDGMKNPFGMSDFGEEFLRNPAPLMMKMDREYMNWQQQETMQIVQTDFKASENSARRYSDNSCFVNGKNDESFAKSVERRQRRMIKNRESAARSRARKQKFGRTGQKTVTNG